ncbi:MAG TPA: molybdenum cofactor guanylyltransferase, partial [Candidatus Hydrogenedentes bacterium]|nr:molybdenum cofactor guanylyltransferase [Candidatus Hydrogenedentota bacterium]HRT21684.1 molybdenum cofactor guanylyltransferase [Candidatus Hydrogenedentota bacterium]HRT66440.1 molybdenum cofactor guanylyltransferase [Candidatus Hydrogenedentota bacterium]
LTPKPRKKHLKTYSTSVEKPRIAPGKSQIIRPNAAAVVLAGGNSTRMGQDKRFLAFHGRPLIEYVCNQLRGAFPEVLVAANDATRLAFLNLPVIPDVMPGQGPLGGIAATLAASNYDLNFFVACDIPFIDFTLVERLMRAAAGCDGAVPATPEGHLEPLFAVYRKSLLPAMRDALARGNRRIRDVFTQGRVNTIPLRGSLAPRNLNTVEEYRALLAVGRLLPASAVPA